jgi:hypothetical protein
VNKTLKGAPQTYITLIVFVVMEVSLTRDEDFSNKSYYIIWVPVNMG